MNQSKQHSQLHPHEAPDPAYTDTQTSAKHSEKSMIRKQASRQSLPIIFSAVMLHVVACQQATAESIASSLGIMVYPADGQSEEQRGADDYACFDFAKTESGYDPIDPPEIHAEQAPSGPSGARLRGAARGAAAGAVIGEIADDDASEGAEVGAALGVMRGGRQTRVQRREYDEHAQEEVSATLDEMEGDFIGAYSICMEARGYAVSQ